MRVALVASNPSHLGPDSPAKRVLKSWIFKLGSVGGIYEFYNVSTSVTPGNRPLKKSEYELNRLARDIDGCTKFVALGNTASDALTRLGIQHFKLPHPSPRNRKLNDQRFVDQLLVECKNYLEERC